MWYAIQSRSAVPGSGSYREPAYRHLPWTVYRSREEAEAALDRWVAALPVGALPDADLARSRGIRICAYPTREQARYRGGEYA